MSASIIIYNLFAVLAFLGAAFFFWRRAREEHFELDQMFDGFILSFLIGIVVARFMRVLLSFDQYGWSLVAWLNVLSNAQFFLPVGVAAAGLYLYRFARQRHWEAYEVLDIWTPAILMGVSIFHLGVTLSGLGNQLQIGPVMLPESLLIAVMSAVLSRYLCWLELRYRTFRWYRAGRDMANSGFIVAVGMIVASAYLLLSTLIFTQLIPSQQLAYVLVYGFGLVFGIGLLLVRAGKFRFRSSKLKKRKQS